VTATPKVWIKRLLRSFGIEIRRIPIQDQPGVIDALDVHTQVALQNWTSVFTETGDSRDLADLFRKYGSDKSSKHNYHVAYASLLRRDAPLNILEIGLGTNNPRIHSTMGTTGSPGAAERAFRDWAPRANVYGADIDESILFTEDRIQTFFVDQTKPETFKELAAKLPPLDLVIDDGLHFPLANLNTINFALPLLKEDGAVVVEDIMPHHLPIWRVAITVLANQCDCRLVQMKTEAIVILRPRRQQSS
jgi:hypothetical protein